MVGPPPDSWQVPRERARAFELAPGVWQLRLPLPWPLVPHVNAYWLADERLLVDCGSARHPSHRASLSAALKIAGASVEDVRTLVDGVLAAIEPSIPLSDGDAIGSWTVVETPGHAPTHVCLFDGQRGTIILGDLLASAFTPWFDYGYSNDPVAEFLGSLDRVDGLGPFALALPGHGRALEDVPAIIADHRAGVAGRLDATLSAVQDGVNSGYVITRRVFGDLDGTAMVWRLTETAAYLRHLRLAGAITRTEDAGGRFRYSAESEL